MYLMTSGERHEGILVLGAPRSGTTLLRRLLDAHPNIACPAETNVFAACGRFLRSERTADGVEIGVLDGLAYAGFSRDEVLARLRQLAFSFHREYAARRGKPRWAAKTAFDVFYLAEIEALCGESCAFVCIQRHGADVACSLQELCEKNGGYLQELHAYVVRHPMMLEAFAHAWVDLTTALHQFAARHPSNALTVKYEELTADPEQTMARIMAFLGETWDPSWTQKALASREAVGLGDWKTYGRSAVDEASVGRWRKLPRYSIAQLARICNPTLELCGYDPLPTDAEEPPDVTRRRYQLGLMLQKLKPDSAREGRSGTTSKPSEG